MIKYPELWQEYMSMNKKDLINSINNCEHLDKDKIKNDEKGDKSG